MFATQVDPAATADGRYNAQLLEELSDRLSGAEHRVSRLLDGAPPENDALHLVQILADLAYLRDRLEHAAGGGKRSSRRVHELLSGLIKRAKGQPVNVIVHDLSGGGALVESDQPLEETHEVFLAIPTIGHAVRATVLDTAHGFTRLSFHQFEPQCAIDFTKHLERRSARF